MLDLTQLPDDYEMTEAEFRDLVLGPALEEFETASTPEERWAYMLREE